VQSDYPPPEAIEKFLAPTTRHVRRVEIYEQDAVTRWTKDTTLRLKSGSVNIEYGRDERRTLDLVLDNSDGVLENAPGEFWYDKIIKVFRGVQVNETVRVPQILVLSDKAGGDSIAAGLRSVLVNAGFGDVQVNVLADTSVEIAPYDIIVGLSNATGGQITLMVNAYREGKSVLVLDSDAVAFGSAVVTGEVGSTVSPGTFTPVANLSHPVAQGWSTFSLLGSIASSDTFTRTVSSSWGSTTSGQAWSTTGGVATDFSVNGSYGEMLLTTIAAREATLSGISLQNLDLTVDVQCSQLAAGAPIQAWAQTRRVDASNYYLAIASFNTSGQIDVAIQKRVTGTFTQLGITNAVVSAYSTTAFYRLRFRVIGTTLQAKLWPATDTEPAAWTVTATDSSFAAAGGITFRGAPNAGNTNTNPAIRFDNFSVTNEAAAPGDTTAYNFSAVTSDTITPIALVGSGSSTARVAALEDTAGQGGKAVIVSALLNSGSFANAEFGKMLASAVSWLNPVTTISTWETQIGEFMIDRISEPNFPHEVKITGRDYAKKCMNSKFAYATQFSGDYALEALISAIASNAGIVKKQLPVTGVVVGKTFHYDRGTSRWEAMKDIATAYNYDLYFNAQGYLVMAPFVDPSTEAPILYIETGTEGQIASYEKSTTDTRIYNFVVVTGESSDSTVPNVYAIAQNTDPSSPTNIDEIGERVYTYTSSFITTTQQAQDVADKFLAIHSLEEFELSFDSLILPWLEVGQILGWIDPNPAAGDPNAFLLTGLTFPLSLGPMSGSARRLTIVG
jgi:hypothetical protein